MNETVEFSIKTTNCAMQYKYKELWKQYKPTKANFGYASAEMGIRPSIKPFSNEDSSFIYMIIHPCF